MRTDLVLEQNVVSYVRTFLGMYTTARSLLSITYLRIYDTYVLGWRWALYGSLECDAAQQTPHKI